MDDMKEYYSQPEFRIVAPAIYQHDTKKVFSTPPEQPSCHRYVEDIMREEGTPFREGYGEKGFLLASGRFVMRRAALMIAQNNGQCEKPKYPGQGLFSDDLWEL